MSVRRMLAVAAVAATFGASNASAAINFVQNGSFENGLTGWTIGGAWADPYPPAAIFYNSAAVWPTGAFGEAVPQNNAPTNSPDAVGQRAAYFVADLATDQSLSQTIGPLAAGTYQIGFSSYAPANGFANIFDATFSGVIATVELASYAVSSGPATTWRTFAGAVNLAAGSYLVEFVFNTRGVPAKDVVIDQVYVIAGNPPVGVPEPLSLALLGSGLLGLAAASRARRRA